MEATDDLQQPDESRPAKRVRMEAPLEITEDVQEEIVDDEDWDDIYETGVDGTVDAKPVDGDKHFTAEVLPSADHQQPPAPDNVADNAASGPLPQYIPPSLDPQARPGSAVSQNEDKTEVEDGIPPDVIDNGEDFDTQQLYNQSQGGPSGQMLEETSQIEVEPAHRVEGQGGALGGTPQQGDEAVTKAQETKIGIPNDVLLNGAEHVGSDTVPKEATPEQERKPASDPDFLAAAAAQRENQEAEWQFNASDAESSSDSSSDFDSDESDSGTDGGYEMLDPAAAAKILMSGDGDDDDGGKGNKSGEDRQPRTTNEKKDEVVPKPDVVVTEDMKITHLGTVDGTVERYILVKGATPGEYQVLEAGSVLCKENREVIGAVAETLGRVQEPMYSVAFTNAQEIEDAALEFGTKLFYVDSHSTFVFTQPLKNLKGTDASNIHDEEVNEDELEFSDDEAEAEYKRQKKAAKRGGRGGLSRNAFNDERAAGSTFGAPGHDSGHTFVNGSDAPQQQYAGGLSYDDGDVQEEFYSPLKRPDNLSQMMAGGGPPRPQFQQNDRGRGRGRGDRGRGDRGRGRGDRGDRGRGRGDRGRGAGGFEQRNQRGGQRGHREDGGGRGRYGQQDGHRGSAHSFPDRHIDGHAQQSPPQRPAARQQSPPLPQQQYPQHQSYQQQQQPNQQAYQFNGYTFQYGNPPPQQQQPSPQQAGWYNAQQQPAASPTGTIPPGSYVNPAFFQNQQQNQWAQPQQQQQQPAYGGGWPAQQHNAPMQQSPYGATPPISQQQQNTLAEILKQFGGEQQR